MNPRRAGAYLQEETAVRGVSVGQSKCGGFLGEELKSMTTVGRGHKDQGGVFEMFFCLSRKMIKIMNIVNIVNMNI